MKIGNYIRRFSAVLTAFAMLSVQLVPAHAAMIGTHELIRAEQARSDQEQLISLLSRDEVRAQLIEMGVDPAVATERVARLTAEELRELQQRFGDLPAGSDVLGILVLIFLVFVITDVIGATDIFPFIHPVR